MIAIQVRGLFWAASLSVLPWFVAMPVRAQEFPSDMVVVRYALRLADWKIVGGESYCHIGRDCRLGFDFDPVHVTLRIAPHGTDLVTIECPGAERGCEMRAQQTAHSYVHRQTWEMFGLLETPIGSRSELVLRPQRRLGAVLLNYKVIATPDADGFRPHVRGGVL